MTSGRAQGSSSQDSKRLVTFLKTLLTKFSPIDCQLSPPTRRREGFDSETRLITHLDDWSRSLRPPQVRFLFLLSDNYYLLLLATTSIQVER